mmetsp:Transcript_18479/g.43171  ORF Transcript_18479/g.43171 Transcript_18479/m.43171 type:complete len:111 (+) Transcript_18479:291-623(+)
MGPSTNGLLSEELTPCRRSIHERACSSLLPRNQQLALAVQTSNSLTYKSFGELSSTYLHPRRSPKSSSSGEIILLLECSSPVLIVEEPGQIGRLLQVSISYPATLSSNSA